MPVQYHVPEEHRAGFSFAHPAFLVPEALLLCAFLVMQLGFRVPEWSSDGERVNGIIVDKWASPAGESDQYTATVRDVETGRSIELELKVGEDVGDRVEAIVLPRRDSKILRADQLQAYMAIWTWALLGLVAWPAVWFALRWNTGRGAPELTIRDFLSD